MLGPPVPVTFGKESVEWLMPGTRPEGFLQVSSDVRNMMLSHGVEAVQEDMESWLTEASQVGSGDDITLGIMYREDAIGLKRTAFTAQGRPRLPWWPWGRSANDAERQNRRGR
jgi:hypothetical protein